MTVKNKAISNDGAAATGTGAGGAGEAMDAGDDGRVGERVGGDVPEVKRSAVATLEVEHLIEVAVVNFAAVTDTDGGSAHEAVDGGGIEIVGEEFEVGVPVAAFAKVFGETGDGLIGDGIEGGEFDVVVATQGFAVIGFEFGLWGGKSRADWIVDEVKGEFFGFGVPE